jgi:hypothetical protein
VKVVQRFLSAPREEEEIGHCICCGDEVVFGKMTIDLYCKWCLDNYVDKDKK